MTHLTSFACCLFDDTTLRRRLPWSIRWNLAFAPPLNTMATWWELAMTRFSIVWLLAVIVTLAVDAKAQDANPIEPAYLYRAQVTRIVDGDTIDVDIDLGFYIWIRRQRIRLLGIDAPEVKGETKVAGNAAAEYLTSLIEEKTVILRTVKGKDDSDRHDSFGRWLGTIYLGGVDINNEMLRAGHAVPYEGR